MDLYEEGFKDGRIQGLKDILNKLNELSDIVTRELKKRNK